MGRERAKAVHWLRAHTGDLLCPQGSAFVSGKASPAWSYFSSSPPSSRTSLWPAPSPLRTLTSPPGRVVWAECPQCTRSDFWLVEAAEGRGSKDFRIMKYPHLCREQLLASLCIFLPLGDPWPAGVLPLLGAVSLGKSSLPPHLSPSFCSSCKDSCKCLLSSVNRAPDVVYIEKLRAKRWGLGSGCLPGYSLPQ